MSAPTPEAFETRRALDAARAENAELNELFELQGRRLSDATKRWQAVTGEHGTLPDLGALLAWLLGEIDKANATDPRIAAWRALDAEQRSYRVEDLRTWADLVEAGAAPDGADHGPSPLRIAAAALEALGEKP